LLLERVRVPKRMGRTSTTSSVVNSVISSDIVPITLSRSSSVSFDNPSIDDSSVNDENHISKTTDSPLLLATTMTNRLSSSLSELDPMLTSRPRTPSPVPPIIIDEQPLTIPADEQLLIIPVDDTIDNQLLQSEKQISTSVEESLDVSEKTEHSVLSSPSVSIANGLNDLSIDRINDELLHVTQEDALDLP
jgi:hypothetical protein